MTTASHHIQVFDPAQCCSTGVCGPDVDPALAAFAAALQVLEAGGVPVARANLAQQPGEFVEDPQASRFLAEAGPDALPLVLVDGRELCRGRYPALEELAAALGLSSAGGACCSPESGCC